MKTRLRIDDRDFGDVSIEHLAARLAGLVSNEHVEVWLCAPDGPSLCLLKSGARVLLMLLRHEGDTGITSRASDRFSAGSLHFILANGQVDEYPGTWTVPFDDARRAAEFFWFHRTTAPFITWHDDSA